VPRIIVRADRPTDIVMLSERISVADFESEHFRAQLLQRLSWAVGDAHAAEQADQDERNLAEASPEDRAHETSPGSHAADYSVMLSAR
jgi:hypothetical protein